MKETKQVIVIRIDLKMSAGKLAAQAKKITLETHNYRIFEKTYSDWCDKNEVWRDYE